MTSFRTTNRLYVALGMALLALGSYALVHPELTRGGSLILLGLASLERGSGGARRLFKLLSKKLEEAPRPRASRRLKAGRPRWRVVKTVPHPYLSRA